MNSASFSQEFAQYFRNIYQAIVSVAKGLRITGRYIVKKPAVTLQYPEQKEQLPKRSRMRLYNDVENCISCTQCAVVCPVDCIYLASRARPSGEAIPKTDDGTPMRLILTQFTIDTALCCYCGLCTTVCPTDCLFHTHDYEFSQYQVNGLKFDYLNDDVKSWRTRLLKERNAQSSSSNATDT